MINIDYVNGSISLETEAMFKPFNTFMESCKNDIDTMFIEFSILEEKVTLESYIMGSVPEKMSVVYESEKKNIFAKIGEMIIAIYNKFVEFVDDIVDKIKTHSFQKKSDLQKLDILLKNHPDLKNEAIIAFNEGALDLSDVKSLKDLDATFDEILKMARQKNVDPASLRGKWEKAKKKFENIDKHPVVKAVSTASTVLSAALVLKTFSAKCAQATNDAQTAKTELRKKRDAAIENLKKAGVIDENTGAIRATIEIWKELNTIHGAARRNEYSVIAQISNAISSFIRKHDNADNND